MEKSSVGCNFFCFCAVKQMKPINRKDMIMKKRFFVMAGILLAAGVVMASCVQDLKSLSGADAGPQMTETRDLKGFEEIEISGSPKVVYTQGQSYGVKVVGPKRFVESIITEVKGKTLSIRNKGKVGIVNIQRDYDDAAVYVTSPDLTAVRLNGSGDFESKQRVDTDKMLIVLRGSGDISFSDIICDHCTTELTGSGDIDIDRLEAVRSNVSLVGSGDIDVKQWKVDNTDLTLRGSGDIEVNFMEGCKKANCQMAGSGDITLKGRLEHYDVQKRGSGEIDTRGLLRD